MTFGSYFAVLVAVAVGLVGIDWWQLHTGRAVHYRLVSHRKLRAVGRLPGDIVATALGSASPPLFDEAEPHPPAPTNLAVPGAGGLNRRATTAPPGALPLDSGGPAQQPVDVIPPDLASTGVQPQGDWGCAAASGPEAGAAAGSVA